MTVLYSMNVRGLLIGQRYGVSVVSFVWTAPGWWLDSEIFDSVNGFIGKVSLLIIKLIIRCIHKEAASDNQINDNQ